MSKGHIVLSKAHTAIRHLRPTENQWELGNIYVENMGKYGLLTTSGIHIGCQIAHYRPYMERSATSYPL